jgi:hypothetical protein
MFLLRHQRILCRQRRQRRLLAAIERELSRDDPRLAWMLETFERVAAGQKMPVHGRVASHSRWSRGAETVLNWLAAAQPEPMMNDGTASSGGSGSQGHEADGGGDPRRHRD